MLNVLPKEMQAIIDREAIILKCESKVEDREKDPPISSPNIGNSRKLEVILRK